MGPEHPPVKQISKFHLQLESLENAFAEGIMGWWESLNEWMQYAKNNLKNQVN